MDKQEPKKDHLAETEKQNDQLPNVSSNTEDISNNEKDDISNENEKLNELPINSNEAEEVSDEEKRNSENRDKLKHEEEPDENAADESEEVDKSVSEEGNSVIKQEDKEKAEKGAEKFSFPENIAGLSQEEKVNLLSKVIQNQSVIEYKSKIEELKTLFYRKQKASLQEKKEKFLQEGGALEDFEPIEDNTEIQFKALYKEYKELKSAENIILEKQKQENLIAKYAIIDEIKDLVNRKESINKTFQEFRELQNRWYATGQVPQGELKNLWETYHHNVETFYDYIKINKELRDLDLKKNLEAKIKLCERAEALIEETDLPKAFRELQELHNSYREIGPAPSDKREEVWLRFKAATTTINKKHQQYYDTLKEEQIKNLEAKTEICVKVEQLNEVEYLKPKKWEEKTKEVLEYQSTWKTIGYAPKKDNNKIYKRFKNACDVFFQNKRDFYEKHKEIQKQNLHLKTELCVEAEAMVDSTDWKNTTRKYIELQKKWKEIGSVPRKYSDGIWKRFRVACDSFFQNKSAFFEGIDGKQEENLKKKKDLIEKLKSFEVVENSNENKKELMQFQKEWNEIGYVPIKQKDEIQKVFFSAFNEKLEKMHIDKNERILLRFKQYTEQLANSRSNQKIDTERNKIINRIRDLESEITLYENNIGFFTNSKNAQSLIDDVNKKISNAQNELELLKSKLKIINQI